MKTAHIRIRKDDDTVLREAADGFVSAWNAGEADKDVFTFSSPAQLFTILSPERWALIEALQQRGASSYGELAHTLSIDVEHLKKQVVILIEWGLVEPDANGFIRVPYDVIHADFDLRSVA